MLVALMPAALWAQSGMGSVRGIVQDQTKAVVPGASVAVTNTATNVELKTETNSAGIFVFPAIVPGSYKLVVEYRGMANFEGSLTVRVQESASLDIVLMPASTSTTVRVEDITPIVKTADVSLGHTLERKRIEELPLNGRNIFNLLQTVPGIYYAETGNMTGYGLRVGAHDVSLDGAAMTDYVDGQGSVRRPPGMDTVQEWRVDANSVSAKYARPTNIVVTTRNGTNQFHGSLFEFNRTNSFGIARARENLDNSAAHYVRNEYGITAGGPFFIPKLYDGRNKSFWFFAYEGYKEHTASIAGVSVPTEAMRNGDFSELKDSRGTLMKIYDPFQTDPVTKLRPQFNYRGVANAIDPALMAPFAKYLFGVMPLPNRPSVNPLVASNYFGPRPSFYDQWTVTGRFDQVLTSKDRLFVRTMWSDSLRNSVSRGVVTTDNGGNWRSDYFPNKNGVVNWTRTFSPTLFNEVSFSASREFGSITTGDPGRTYATEFGLPNPSNQEGYPVVGAIGLRNPSGNFMQPQSNRIRFFNFFVLDDNATKIWGKHEFQFGAHLRYDQLTYLPQQQRAAGAVNARAIATALYDPARRLRDRGVLNTGNALAAFYLGLADYQYRQVKGKYYVRGHENAFYFQDNWKVTPRLNLNLGLRWQLSPFPTDKYNIISSWDEKNSAIVLGRDLNTLYQMGAATPAYVNNLVKMGAKFETADQAGLPYKLVNDNWHDLGPHIGLAYRALDGKKSFVIRAGYSLNYFPIPVAGWNDRFRLNAPFTAFWDNRDFTAAWASPDGIQNYGLVGIPKYIAGKNSANAIDVADPHLIELGGDSFQAAYWVPDQPTPRVHDWNFTLEKGIGNDMVARAAYIGNHSSHQDLLYDQNQTIPEYVWYKTRLAPLPEGDWATVLQRPLGRVGFPWGDIQQMRRDGWGNGNGVQLEFERRYGRGFGFQVFYIMMNAYAAGGQGWQTTLDPTTSYLPSAVPADLHERAKLLMYSLDTTIPKHLVRWNFLVDLPVGKGKPLLHNAPSWLNHIVGGWQVKGMGFRRSNYFSLPTDLWPTGTPVEFYGNQYPIQDCTSGECKSAFLLWNGYIPAHLINKPDGYMGIPANYKPAAQPLWPYPANYASLNEDIDPNYGYYGTNLVTMKLNNGDTVDVDKGDLHPWIHQPALSTWLSNMDAAIGKNFPIREGINLRFQADFFNVFNHPGNDWNASGAGVITTDYGMNSPRMMQLSLRLSW